MIAGSGTTRAGRPARVGVVVVGAMLALSACSGGGDGENVAPAATPIATASGTVTASENATGKTTGSGTSAGTARSTTELAPYFAAAERADANLRRAATMVNGGMSKDRLRIRPEVVPAIEVAAPDRLRSVIPAGMPPELMRSVLLTYSDLASRYYAMRFVAAAGDPRREVVVLRSNEISPTLEEILLGLGEGAPAARRFAGDLAGAKALAARYRLSGAGPRSRAAAEIAVRTHQIESANGCCEETGGEVFTDLVPVTWTGGREGRSWTGKVNNIGFHTNWTGDTWDVQLAAG